MTNQYVLIESFTNGLNYDILTIITVTSIVCSILVITSKNPIVSVLFLIGLFLSVASYLMMLGINFIGLSYLLVYVGAVSILFLFILMLINVRISELVTDNNNSIPLVIMMSVIFNIALYALFPWNSVLDSSILVHENILNKFYFFKLNVINNLSFVTSNVWDGAIAEVSHITSIGNIIYTAYPLWLIITSIILLLAMVGAIIITIKH